MNPEDIGLCCICQTKNCRNRYHLKVGDYVRDKPGGKFHSRKRYFGRVCNLARRYNYYAPQNIYINVRFIYLKNYNKRYTDQLRLTNDIELIPENEVCLKILSGDLEGMF